MKKLCSILLSSLLVLGAVCAVSFTGAAATEQATYEVFDFEDASASNYVVYTDSTLITKDEVVTIDAENAISGAKSLLIFSPKSTSDNNKNQRVCVELGKFDQTKTYRVSGSFKLLEGKAGGLYIVNTVNNPNNDQFYNYKTLSGLGRAIEAHAMGSGWTETKLQTFSGNMKTSGGSGNIAIAFKAAGSNSAKVLFDDITIAEIVTVSAGVNDANMGTATVANKAGHADYAARDTAVFTASPNEGYVFSHWQDVTGASVATTATYEAQLTGDTALTAVFVAEQEESAIATAYNNAVAIRTAQASSTGKQGMRVYNSIDKTAGDTATEYGSIAIRAGYLETVRAYVGQANAEFDLDLYNAFQQKHGSTPGFGKGVSRQTGGTPLLWETTETDYIFTSYLTGIDKQYYGDTYLIRSYMIDAKGNVTYGDIYEASVFNTVYNILQQETEGDGVTAANAIIEEAGQGVYDAWVAEKYPAQ